MEDMFVLCCLARCRKDHNRRRGRRVLLQKAGSWIASGMLLRVGGAGGRERNARRNAVSKRSRANKALRQGSPVALTSIFGCDDRSSPSKTALVAANHLLLRQSVSALVAAKYSQNRMNRQASIVGSIDPPDALNNLALFSQAVFGHSGIRNTFCRILLSAGEAPSLNQPHAYERRD